ncbi:TonB-dependent receptor [Niabella insulamsoli]|uniref:TonB-dependent receptor n=1 Tax=Niabella insulamsoli TaxID=3144874 RepID=UPI0031FC00A2
MKLFIVFTLFTGMQAFAYTGAGQEKVTLELENARLSNVLRAVQKQTTYRFAFSNKVVDDFGTVNVRVKDIQVMDLLPRLLKGTGLEFVPMGKTLIVVRESAETRAAGGAYQQAPTIGTGISKQLDIEVTGQVTDSAGQILSGVSVSVKSKPSVGTTTDLNGRYILKVPEGSVLVFTMTGYQTQEIPVGSKTSIDVVMRRDVQNMEDVVITAFGQRAKKRDLIGSVTSINPSELKIPASNLTTAIQGRIAGVVAFQRSGEPGADNADFFIRGVSTFGVNQRPLILLDNMEVTVEDLARVPVDDIEGFSILRDATASAVYGSRGANGVILVTTKSGREGPPKIFLKAEQRVSTPTKRLDLADPVTFMVMNREAILTRDPLAKDQQEVYSLEKIDRTIAGDDPNLYPAIDWLDFVTKKVTTTRKYYLNISGGTQMATYSISGDFSTDNGLLKVSPINDFNSNVRFNVYNLRSNISLNITKTTSLKARLNLNVQDYNGPPVTGSEAFGLALRSNPVLFQPVYTPPESMSWIRHPMFGNYAEGGYTNAYAEIVRGYSERKRSNMYFQLDLNQKLSFITEGLAFRGLLNLTRNSFLSQRRVYNPFYYTPIQNFETGLVDNYQVINPEGGTEYLNFVPNERDQAAILYGETQLSYNREFGDHNISGMVVGTLRDNVQTPESFTLLNTLPYRNVSLSGNATYSLKQKYFAQFTFGYNASERFDEKFRWGFFPSFGAAWTVDRESFMESLKPTISKLRFRFTYGWLGNDNVSTSNNRFFYQSIVNLNAGGRGYTFGLPTVAVDPYAGVSIQRYENPNVQWEISRQTNFGIDLGLFNGALTFTGDYYRQYRYNIVQERAGVTASAGFQADILANVGKYKSHGFDAEIVYNKNFSRDFWIQSRGTFTYSTGSFIFYDEPTYAYPYLSRVGLHANQTRGYIAERLFIDDAEVRNSPQQLFGGEAVLGGDIKYVDVNNDGVVNGDDIVPIGYPTVPEITYGFGPSIGYKSFDLSFFFSAIARTSLFIRPYYKSGNNYGVAPFGNRFSPNSVLQVWADSYWSEENQDIYARWPRLSQTPTANNTQNSTFWMRDGGFIRLKQAELGYNLKGIKLKTLNIQSLRMYLSGTNLFRIGSFKLWDPEMGGNGLAYPLQRVFNFGIIVNL